ncbi:MAG: DUF2652 domain-containing protein [Candidatus Limnocylindria bacterium]
MRTRESQGCAAGADAVFWLSDEHGAGLAECLKETFVEFHRRLRFMTLATTCRCRACASVGSLTLKFVVHRGEYVQQRVAGSDHFVGSDIVLAHRLLKNKVPSHEYILLTEAALAAVAAEGSVAHEEQVEQLGAVRCAYIELTSLRARALAERTEHLGRREAQVCFERSFRMSPERIRRVMRDESFHGIGEHFELLEDPQGLEEEADRTNARTPFVPRTGMKRARAEGSPRHGIWPGDALPSPRGRDERQCPARDPFRARSKPKPHNHARARRNGEFLRDADRVGDAGWMSP